MRIRMMAFCFALVSAFATASAFAQDCAPCAAAGDVSCAPCATCATCAGRSCELFGGLRSLLACRPCVVSDVAVTSCSVPTPTCGPIVSSNLPSCGPAAPCGTCGDVTCGGTCEIGVCAPAPVCGGEMFPYLKPCLYNAVHRPVNGVCKIVHGVFGALADVTTPTSDAGFFKPAYVKEICCGTCGEATCNGTCGTCGSIETAPQPCMPAIPSCK